MRQSGPWTTSARSRSTCRAWNVALGGLAGLGLVTLATRKPMLGLGVVGFGAVAGGILGATLLSRR